MSKRNPDEQLRDGQDLDNQIQDSDDGTFERVGETELAGRKILKPRRRNTPTSMLEGTEAGANPFASANIVSTSTGPAPDQVSEGMKTAPSTSAADSASATPVDTPTNNTSNKSESAPTTSTPATTTTTTTTTNGHATETPAPSTTPEGSSTPSKSTAANTTTSSTPEKKLESPAKPAADTSNTPAAPSTTTTTTTTDAGDKKEGSTPDKKPYVFGASAFPAAPFTFSFGSASNPTPAPGAPAASPFPQFTFPAFPNTFGTAPAAGGAAPLFSFAVPPAATFPAASGSQEGGDDDDDGAVETEEDNIDPSTVVNKVKTGEEDEKTVFSVRAKLFASEKAVENGAWKERGVGQFKVNVEDASKKEEGAPATAGPKCRLVMRAEGAKRLILNVALFPAMSVERAADKQVRFIASEKAGGVTSFLVRMGKKEEADELIQSIADQKKLLPS